MMGHKERLDSCDEWDAFHRYSRSITHWRPGVLRRIKRAFSKRVRKAARKPAETD